MSSAGPVGRPAEKFIDSQTGRPGLHDNQRESPSERALAGSEVLYPHARGSIAARRVAFLSQRAACLSLLLSVVLEEGWQGLGVGCDCRLDRAEFDLFAESLAEKMGSTFEGVVELLVLAASEIAEPRDLSVLQLIQACPSPSPTLLLSATPTPSPTLPSKPSSPTGACFPISISHALTCSSSGEPKPRIKGAALWEAVERGGMGGSSVTSR